MDAEFKAKTWFGKIFNKLEKIVVELDTLTSQNTRCSNSSDPSELKSARVEPNKVSEDSSSGTCHVQQHHARVALPSSDPPSHQNFEISGNVGVQGDSLEENSSTTLLPGQDMVSSSPLLDEYCDGSNLTPATTLGDEEPMVTNEESQVTNTLKLSDGEFLVSPVEEVAEESRVESCIDVVSTEPTSTQTSLKSIGIAVECNDDMLSSSPGLEEYGDANLTPATTLGDEKPIITDEESQVTNTLILSAGEFLVSPVEEMAEESRVESCIDVVSTEPTSTQTSQENLGTAVECNNDLVPAPCGISKNYSNHNPIDTKILDAPVQDNEANMRSSDADSTDGVINGNSDVATLHTNAFHDMAFREDPSYVDENALYAVSVRIKKLRSFKRKILDALTSKRRREEEYEQLAIWFGDAEMCPDLATSMDSKSSQLESEDSQWELL